MIVLTLISLSFFEFNIKDLYVCVVSHILNVCLKKFQSHRKVQSHNDWSVANALTSTTDFRRYIRVSWNCKCLKVIVSSLSVSHLQGSGKSGKSNNMNTISRKVCSNSQIHVNSNFLLFCSLRTDNNLRSGLRWWNIIWYF